ncbi:Calcipressin-3 [Holothuria leucospilota]|uniref:Calcipressin-3 n=1 Tax=Holothuria leucospilota TaxID=206669 RepID=A0A9Q0YTQ4_HOLLE|nr:Calcipressin-3 [Holothuria leucospilota]
MDTTENNAPEDRHEQGSDVKRTQSDLIEETIDYSVIPPTLVATNVSNSVFFNENEKLWFEGQFKKFGGPVTFQYFKSFHRVRINYQSGEESLAAKIALHKREICGQEIGVYFIQVQTLSGSSQSLEPPEPDKQFMLSPPASPPVGWAPVREAEPVINYDLLSALTNLSPGESHELHPGDGGKPKIVVHTCENVDQAGPKLKIVHTKRPEV